MAPVASGDTARTARSPLDTRVLLVVATVLFGLSVRASSPRAGIAVAVGTLLGAAVFWIDRGQRETPARRESQRREVTLLIAVVAFSFLGFLWWAPTWIGEPSPMLDRLPAAAWGLLGFWFFVNRRSTRTRFMIGSVVGVSLVLTLVVGLLHIDAAHGRGVDVYFLHQGAADAIAEGHNPYTDVVEVPNGAPTAAEGDTIVGYPYPPIVALVYSLGEWTLGDARYASLASWLAVLAMLGVSAYRRRSRERVWVLLLLAAIPGWPLVLRLGWTEPLTLAFLVAAFLVWRRPAGSGIGLGLALASKQYFALVAPLALLHRDRGWQQRLLVVATVVALAVIPVAMLDPSAFWSSAVEFHTSTPLRTDSTNVIGALSSFGVTWAPPRWLGPVAGVAMATVTGALSRTRRSFFVGMALAFATSFLLASQALPNYWFLVTGLCALGVITEATQGSVPSGSDTADRAASGTVISPGS